MSDPGLGEQRGKSCPAGEDVLAGLQGELTPVEQALIEKHCGSCDACRRRVDEFRGVLARMRDVPAATVGRDLAPVILARIPAAEWSRSARWLDIYIHFPQLARVAAALVLLVSAGAVLFVAVRSHRNENAVVANDVAKQSGAKGSGKQEAIACGLAWLAAHQEADGSWDAEKWGARKEHTVGITALSLLAFMGRDSDPINGPYHGAIRRGIRFLVGQQDVGGRVGPVCANAMYNHGMATVALLKARRLDPGKAWTDADAGDQAVDFACAAQKESGGWGYSEGSEGAANTSITVWQLQSLMLAEAMGRRELAPRIERSMAWLRGMVDVNGRMGYSREEASPNGYETLTAAGILCLLAGDSHPKDNDRVALLVRSLEASAGRQGKTIDYYRWYFMTQALQSTGSTASKEVAGHMQELLIAQQAQKGPGAGSWELGDRWSPAGGRIYTTSMALLSLE